MQERTLQKAKANVYENTDEIVVVLVLGTSYQFLYKCTQFYLNTFYNKRVTPRTKKND